MLFVSANFMSCVCETYKLLVFLEYKIWRLACANVVTVTLAYILYLYWIVQDLKSATGNNLLQVDDGR